MLERCLASLGRQLQVHLTAAALTSTAYEDLQLLHAAELSPATAHSVVDTCSGSAVSALSISKQEHQQQQEQQQEAMEDEEAQAAPGYPVSGDNDIKQQQQQQQQRAGDGVLQPLPPRTPSQAAPSPPPVAAAAAAATGASPPRSRWLLPPGPHIPLLRRACEPSLEERFTKAGIPLALLNRAGQAGFGGTE